MTNKQFFIHTVKKELPVFDRVFKAVEKTPKTKHSYKHDAKSRTTLELIEHTFGVESGAFPLFLKTGMVDFGHLFTNKPKWKSVADVRKHFAKNMASTVAIVSKMKDAEWEGGKTDMVGGGWKTTKSDMAWTLLLDLIHHRGQLSTHIRPMGGKVPSIYGPSADSK